MDIKELKSKVDAVIADLKNNGKYPKENDLVDYKMQLNIMPRSVSEVFMNNFSKDILSFANADGGIILIGIKENKQTGIHEDIGLDETNLNLLAKLDLNDVSQKFKKLIGSGVSIDLQEFQMGTRKFYYLIIQKSFDTLIPINESKDYKIEKGAIYYRASGKTEYANSSSSEFNRFIQIKANEKSKEFMEIWSKLLPEMVDINPKEVLILNPQQNKIYGFNNKEKTLSGSNIEIDKSQEGVFNIILNAISAGEIGKITDDEGKPIYKLMGEIHSNSRAKISLSNLEKAVNEESKYSFTNMQLKAAIHSLGWVNSATFTVRDPPAGTVNALFNKFIWIEMTDQYSQSSKVYFSPLSTPEIARVINDDSKHQELFNKRLSIKKTSEAEESV